MPQVTNDQAVTEEVFSIEDQEFKSVRTNPYGFWYLTHNGKQIDETFTSLLDAKEGAQRYLQKKAKKK